MGHYQGSFRPEKSTTDQISNLWQLLQKTWEFNFLKKSIFCSLTSRKLMIVFINQKSSINIKRKFNLSHKLIKLVEINIMETFL